MATAAQIAANRRNALRSTGPRTAGGKVASSRNALRHGLTARATVVLDEDAEEFQRLRAEFWTDLAPRDAREELLVETVVQAAWRMRRAWRAEARLFNRVGRLDRAFSQPRELLTIIRHEASANRAFHRGLVLLERGRSAAAAAGPSRRQGEQPQTIVYEKGTQFPDAEDSSVRPSLGAPTQGGRLETIIYEKRTQSPDAADHSARPSFAASTQGGRPETIIYEKRTQSPDARPARAEPLGAPGVLAVRSEPAPFAETCENARGPPKIASEPPEPTQIPHGNRSQMALPRRPFLCNRPAAPP